MDNTTNTVDLELFKQNWLTYKTILITHKSQPILVIALAWAAY